MGRGRIICGRGRGVIRGRGIVVDRGVGSGRNQNINPVNDYVQATSTNLPTMSYLKIVEYFQSLRSPELRQAKDSISGSAEYGDSAIGYVRIKRDGIICIVEARVTPQTSVNKKAYEVAVHIKECDKDIIAVSCNCQASMGNCKHETALIFWLLRRSDEPSPTDTVCYWKKSLLSTVKNLKSKTVDELSNRNTDMRVCDDSLLKMFIEMGKSSNKEAGVIRYHLCKTEKTMYVDHMFISFTETYSQDERTCKNFLTFCSKEMTPEICRKVFDETSDQSTKAEWYYQRFGRITASKLYECSRCKTSDGSLVDALMGARGFKGNAATKRGQRLESEVFDLLKKTYRDLRKCGILVRRDMPIFGASPDGISDEYVFEIKCPSKDKTVQNYIKDEVVNEKVYFQMQLQMLMCDKKIGVLCVADPKFEENKKIYVTKVRFNENKLKVVLKQCQVFWEKFIFPLLK